VKNVFFGNVATVVSGFTDISKAQAVVLTSLTFLIFAVGVYPDPFFKMIYETVGLLVNRFVTI
jgi:NADH:ubiquinone oxidoreductase subunit 4 (subunit M)